MELFIRNNSSQPIYVQLTDQIRSKILSGELAENEMLPSIRLLAKELRISVITTKRAYDDLEAAGLIYTIPKKGSSVAPQNMELRREASLKDVEDLLQKALDTARQGGISSQEVKGILELLLEGDDSL